jgi:hypothetical protein
MMIQKDFPTTCGFLYFLNNKMGLNIINNYFEMHKSICNCIKVHETNSVHKCPRTRHFHVLREGLKDGICGRVSTTCPDMSCADRVLVHQDGSEDVSSRGQMKLSAGALAPVTSVMCRFS